MLYFILTDSSKLEITLSNNELNSNGTFYNSKTKMSFNYNFRNNIFMYEHSNKINIQMNENDENNY